MGVAKILHDWPSSSPISQFTPQKREPTAAVSYHDFFRLGEYQFLEDTVGIHSSRHFNTSRTGPFAICRRSWTSGTNSLTLISVIANEHEANAYVVSLFES